MVHIFNLSTREAEAGGFLWVWSLTGLYNKSQASQHYTVRCLSLNLGRKPTVSFDKSFKTFFFFWFYFTIVFKSQFKKKKNILGGLWWRTLKNNTVLFSSCSSKRRICAPCWLHKNPLDVPLGPSYWTPLQSGLFLHRTISSLHGEEATLLY